MIGGKVRASANVLNVTLLPLTEIRAVVGATGEAA